MKKIKKFATCLRFPKMQGNNTKDRKISGKKLGKSCENVKRKLYYYNILYISKI